MSMGYQIELEQDGDTILVTCHSLPEVNTFGDDEAEARVFASQAIEEALAARINDGRDIPAFDDGPGVVFLPLLTRLKVALYRELAASGWTRAELMRRMNVSRETVDRLFRLDHASRLDQIEAAMRALGREVEFSVSKAA